MKGGGFVPPPLDRKDKCMAKPFLQNGNMSQRHSMQKKASKKNFTKHASHTKHENFVSGVMRGGIRF